MEGTVHSLKSNTTGTTIPATRNGEPGCGSDHLIYTLVSDDNIDIYSLQPKVILLKNMYLAFVENVSRPHFIYFYFYINDV